MYKNKYKDQKGSEDNDDKITQKESKMFSPSLTKIKEDQNRDFVPNLTGTDKKERNFTPSLEMPEKMQTSVKPGEGGLIPGSRKKIDETKNRNQALSEDVTKQIKENSDH